MNTDIRKLLEGVSNGTLSIEDALLKLKAKPFEDIATAAAASPERRVMRMVPWPFFSMVSAIPMICSGVFPAP